MLKNGRAIRGGPLVLFAKKSVLVPSRPRNRPPMPTQSSSPNHLPTMIRAPDWRVSPISSPPKRIEVVGRPSTPSSAAAVLVVTRGGRLRPLPQTIMYSNDPQSPGSQQQSSLSPQFPEQQPDEQLAQCMPLELSLTLVRELESETKAEPTE